MAPEEYPKLPKEESAPLVQVTGATLLEMIKKTAFAISTDETRYILNGVFFEPREGGKVRMVATDGHRLALVERELAGDFKLKSGVIIPRKGLFELKRLLDEAPDAECHAGLRRELGALQEAGPHDGDAPHRRPVPRVPARHPQGRREQVQVARVRFLEALKRIALLSRRQVERGEDGARRQPAAHHRATTRTWARPRTISRSPTTAPTSPSASTPAT